MHIGFHYGWMSPILWVDPDPIQYKVAVHRGNPHTKTQLNPFRRLATVDQCHTQAHREMTTMA